MLVYWSVKVGNIVSKIATKVRAERNTRTEKEQHRLLTKPHSRRRFSIPKIHVVVTYSIHGTGIFTYILVDFSGFHVGKYTSPKDAVCNGKNPPLRPRDFSVGSIWTVAPFLWFSPIHNDDNNCKCLTLPETNIGPENGWLEDDFPWRPIFRCYVSFTEGTTKNRLEFGFWTGVFAASHWDAQFQNAKDWAVET